MAWALSEDLRARLARNRAYEGVARRIGAVGDARSDADLAAWESRTLAALSRPLPRIEAARLAGERAALGRERRWRRLDPSRTWTVAGVLRRNATRKADPASPRAEDEESA